MKDNALLVVAGVGVGFLTAGLVFRDMTLATIGAGVIVVGGLIVQVFLPQKEERND